MKHLHLSPVATASAIGLSLGLAVATPVARAQYVQETTTTSTSVTTAPAAAAEDVFSSEIGRAVVDRDGGATSTYTVAATQDIHSKLTGAKLRFTVVEKDATGSTTHLLTINTGKYKTVLQLVGTVADIFRKYLDVPPANQEIGKIGDLSHGGEMHFVAESAAALRYDWMTPGEPVHSTRFKRTDIQVFLGILTHPGGKS